MDFGLISGPLIASTLLGSVGAATGAGAAAGIGATVAAGLTTAEIIGLAGSALGAVGALTTGLSAGAAADAEATQATMQAKAEQATSQRAASEERREGRIAISRAQALAAASGAGATDPTVLDLTSDIAGQSEYNALSALYEGNTAAQALQYQAAVKRQQASQARTAGYIGAGSKLLMGASTLFDKYGGGGPEATGYG